MSRRLFRRVWVTASNGAFLGFIASSFLRDYELSTFGGAFRPSSGVLDRIGPFLLALLLTLGIVLEWLQSEKVASMVNVGLFTLLSFAVLGKALLMVLTKSRGLYDPEAGLAITIVGLPCAVIAAMDSYFYWAGRAGAED